MSVVWRADVHLAHVVDRSVGTVAREVLRLKATSREDLASLVTRALGSAPTWQTSYWISPVAHGWNLHYGEGSAFVYLGTAAVEVRS